MIKTPKPLPRISSRYKRLEALGAGAVGAVYKAFDTVLERPVAIKVLSSESASADEVQYFKREFQTVADLEHPNLVKVFDFGQAESGELFYSMELLPSGSLDSLKPPLDQTILLSITVQVCRALQYIHSRGIIHRDIKPANVLIQELPNRGKLRVKLVDFGLAAFPKGAVATSRYGGTPAYAAPEVLAQGAVDARADLFSLGVMLYELGTSGLPFSWKDGAMGQIPRPTSLNKKLTKAMDTLVLKLLEFEPFNRYRTANSVIEAINHLFGKKLALETSTTGTSYVLTPALVGRDKELTTIKRELKAIAGLGHQPEAGVILLSGQTGIGKTRLAQEAKQFCQLSGIVFCQGQSMSDSLMPGAPVIQALRSLLSTLPPDKAPKLPPVLSQVLGVKERKDGPVFVDSSAFAESVYQLLIESAKIAPIALCIEDIHLADAVTLGAIGYMSRGLYLSTLEEPTFDVLCRIILTVDDTITMSKEQRVLLKQLRKSSYTKEIRPENLSVEEIAKVVASMFDTKTLPEGGDKRLHEATSGLPLFLQQLMAQLVHNGIISQETGRWKLTLSDLESVRIPQGTKERTEAILMGLTSAERNILETIAIMTLPSDAKDISTLAKLPYLEVRQILATLSTRAIVDHKKDTYSLQSGPLKTSIYSYIHWSKRRRLHLATAKLINKKKMSRRAKTHALAHHYLAAKHKDGALRWGLEAAQDSAKSEANLEAAAYYKQLLGLDLDPKERPKILCEYGKCLVVTEARRRALRIFIEALDLAPKTDGRLRAELQKLIGDVLTDIGDLKSGRQWLRKAINNLVDSPSEMVRACTALVFLELNAGRPKAADKYLERAKRATRKHKTGNVLMSFVNRVTGIIMADRGKSSDALACFREALKNARDARDLEAERNAHSALGVLHHRRGEFSRSLEASIRALDISRIMSDPATVALQLMNIGAVRYDNGEYSALTRDLLEACSLFSRADSQLHYSLCLGNLALTWIQLGQYEKAFEYIRHASSIQDKHGYQAYAIISKYIMTQALIQTGQIKEALHLSEKNAGNAQRAGFARQIYLAQKTAAEALFLEGLAEDAVILLHKALEGFREIGERDEVCECLIGLATLSEALGRSEIARSSSSEAMEIADKLGAKPIQLKASIAITPRYAQDVKRISRLSSRTESPELRWRAHAACAKYFENRGIYEKAIEEYSSCVGIFRSVTADMKDPTLRDGYLRHPSRLDVFNRIRWLNSN